MKLSSQWKTLTKAQRRAWSAWARNNRVLLDDGNVRRASGHKAMTMVLRNRTAAGDAANPSVLPTAATWRDGSLSVTEAGPFTTGAGYVGFRAETNLPAGTKWFVWATGPVTASEAKPEKRLRFIKCMTLGALTLGDVVPNLGADYGAVHGSWDGPGVDGEWPTPTYVWFRVHHYVEGQLSPGVMLRGQIFVEI